MTAAARRLTVLLLTTLYAFGFIDRVVIALVAQDLKADLGISDLQIGLLSGTAFSLVNAIASLPLARLADRWRRSFVVAGSLLIGSAFTSLCAGTTRFSQLIVLRLGMAAGSAGTEAPAHSMISDMYDPNERTSALAIFMLGVPLASVIGSYAGGSIAQTYGWRATFLALGLTGLAVSLIGLRVMPEPPRRALNTFRRSDRSILLTLFRLWRQAHCRHILFGMAVVSLGTFGVNTFLPSFLAQDYGVGTGKAGFLFGLVSGVASAAGSLAGGFGSERLARHRPGWLMALPGLGLYSATPILIFAVTRQTLASVVPLLLFGSFFTYMAMGPAIATLHGTLDSRSRATGSALFLVFVHLIGQGIGPPLAGFASDRFAAWQFGSGHFATLCAGAAGQVPGSACALASAIGIRYAIAAFTLFYLWAGFHFIYAAWLDPSSRARRQLAVQGDATTIR